MPGKLVRQKLCDLVEDMGLDPKRVLSLHAQDDQVHVIEMNNGVPTLHYFRACADEEVTSAQAEK